MLTFKELVVTIGISGISGFVSKYFSRHFGEPTDNCLLQKKNDLKATNGWLLTLTLLLSLRDAPQDGRRGAVYGPEAGPVLGQHWGDSPPICGLPFASVLGKREIINSTHKAGVRIKRSCT